MAKAKRPARASDDAAAAELVAFCRGALADAETYPPRSFEGQRARELLGVVVAWSGRPDPGHLVAAQELAQMIRAGLAAAERARSKGGAP